ncbi:MAG TPA: site-specific integrase [Propionibacteriaceae bacterium]
MSGKTREEVREKYLALHQAARRGPVASSVPTLGRYLEGWLADVVRPSLAPKTATNYEIFSRLYIIPGIGAKRLDKLSVRDVQVWINRLREQCQCCAQGKDASRRAPRCCAIGRCCNQIPKDWTVHQAWRVLRAALSQAVRDELVPRNVAALVRVPLPRSKVRSSWTVSDARRFLEFSFDNGDPMHAGYVLMLVLGLRRGELLGLRWDDIDLETGSAQIRSQLQRIDGRLVLRPTKTISSEAVLPLPEPCVHALAEHRAVVERWRADAGKAWHENDLVFSTRYGLPLDPRNFHRRFKAQARKAGVPVVSVHSTRRTCASLLVELDVHPRVAMQILRHSRISITMDIYSQVAAASTRDALGRLGTTLAIKS